MEKLKPVKHVIEQLFLIPDKKGDVVPFILNNIQKDIHETRTGRDDILKFRQGGCTSFVEAWFLTECMNSYTRAVMIAHDKEHTERLLQRCHFFLSTLRGPKPQLKKANDQEIIFSKTHSSFYIGTAGSRQFGRSDTITHLHCSEYAFWKNPKSLMQGLFQAVPHDTGVIVKETTANGMGTYHHNQYKKAMQGLSRFKDHFYPWQIFEEYQSPVPKDFEPTIEELSYMKEINYALTEGQLQFRREKVIDDFDGNVDLFNQEYPGTINMAFIVTGGSLFSDMKKVEDGNWEKSVTEHGGALFVLKPHPIKGLHYVIGSDVSGGTGNDYSCMQIVCVETAEQVAEYRINTMKPPPFAEVLIDFGLQFNTAYLVVESNQHGLSVLSILKDKYPTGRIYREIRYQKVNSILRAISNYGFKTTATSKPFVIGLLMQYLQGPMTIHGIQTETELHEFTETETGKLGGPSDDLVIALACACVGLQKEQKLYAINPEPKVIQKPYEKETACSFDDIMSRIKHQREESWFQDQVDIR